MQDFLPPELFDVAEYDVVRNLHTLNPSAMVVSYIDVAVSVVVTMLIVA